MKLKQMKFREEVIMDKEIMNSLQKQFNKVNRKIQILNNEVDTLKKIKYINSAITKAELKQSIIKKEKTMDSKVKHELKEINMRLHMYRGEIRRITETLIKEHELNLKQSENNNFFAIVAGYAIFFILGMIAYKYLALSGVVK